MDLLKKLNITHPIFLAPMAGVSTPALAAAVSNAGGLGSLGLGASSVDTAKQQIKETTRLTKRPFQINFFCHQPEHYNEQQALQWIEHVRPQFAKFDAEPVAPLKKVYLSFLEHEDYLNLVLDTRPKVVSFHFGLPTNQQMSALKQAGIMTMVCVTQLSEAIAAQQVGVDVLIVQGVEAGGHRGMFNPVCDPALSTADLLLLLQGYIDLPIVVAGGIMTGADIQLYLDLGASAAQLGTAFVQCAESAASEAYRQALFEQPITQITQSISGRPARGLLNAWHQYIDTTHRPANAGYPYSYDLGKQLNAAAVQVDEYGFSPFWAGSNVAAIRRMDADELMQALIQELG